jgi:hypothetical protein
MLQAFDSLTHVLIVRDMLAWDTTSASSDSAAIADPSINEQHIVNTASVGLRTALTITVTVRCSSDCHLISMSTA